MHRLLPLFFLFAFLVPAHAHEVRPGYIEITEVARDSFDIVWKQPVRSAGANAVAGLGLRPVFPENCARLGDSRMRRLPGALVEKFSLTCYGGLFGQSVGVEGLQRTITDVLVQLALIEGGRYSLRLTADAPVQTFSGGGTFLMAYFGLGVEHLVLGLDHILFVLGLVLLVQGWRSLIWVITAFTLAHSLTLGLSMLGRISAPSAVVEAIIALSILFVAIERWRRVIRKPWPLGLVCCMVLVLPVYWAKSVCRAMLNWRHWLCSISGWRSANYWLWRRWFYSCVSSNRLYWRMKNGHRLCSKCPLLP
jgi:hypothetical protein